MTEKEAVSLYESEWWVGRSAEEVARWQLNEERLCMPFANLHHAAEKALGRSVWSHEFAAMDTLADELDGKVSPPDNPIDSLAALLLSLGRDPDETMIVLEVPE